MPLPIAPALRALLEQIIDYAGMFPPAGLPCATAVAHFSAYRTGEHAWLLRRLVVSAKDLENIPNVLDGEISVLSDIDTPRAGSLESRRIISADRPAYCEVPISELDTVSLAGRFAKIRTGSLKPEGIPTISEVAAYISACADHRLAFKATAGLHHPIRAEYPLTYETDAPRAVMHGFLNVFLAACFAWHGDRNLELILAETDPTAFRFDQRAHWRSQSLDVAQVREARHCFAHAFGSCSFEEPIRDLEALGLL
jgi:hypothetical protein